MGSKTNTTINITDNKTQNFDSTTTDRNIQNKEYNISHTTRNTFLHDDIEGNVNNVRNSINNAYQCFGKSCQTLQELTTNIHDLRTSGLLNSHANRWTTTNVGHMLGDRHSVISLGLEELSFMDKLKSKAHFTDAQVKRIEARADHIDAAAKRRITASKKLSDEMKVKLIAMADAEDAEIHKYVEAHRVARLL